ncbi:hypothetical protein ACFY9S_28205 [Streptomyces sp. NPDC012474]|uniref:hypothetical protein n=1 Tax=Streptomyces sp. NPDC012474 TaxID=3364836 RepID=UPI0036E3F05A
MRRIAMSLAVITIAGPLVGCGALRATGSSGDVSPTKGNDITVGLLLPENTSPQYETFHYPIIEAKVESLTRGQGRVEYANAEADAGKQSRQLQHMVDERVDVILHRAAHRRRPRGRAPLIRRRSPHRPTSSPSCGPGR